VKVKCIVIDFWGDNDVQCSPFTAGMIFVQVYHTGADVTLTRI